MPRIIISQLASRNIRSIANYIAQERPRVAQKFYDECEALFPVLADFPRMGKLLKLQGTRDPEIRMMVLKTGWPYVVFYRPVEGGVEILRVHDSRRKLPDKYQVN
jgi:toxin ParE1/3/4